MAIELLCATTLPPEGILITAPWEVLHDSPFQYRKTHNETGLDDLAKNIRETGGIHQPILARRRFPNPLFTEYNPADGLEVVAGHRRKIAGMRADLPGGPCVVKDLTDEQSRKIQITENLQRQDVHAIEEAEGFQELIDQHGETADRIAEQFGKSRSYVYGRLKLLALCPEVRKACLAGEIQTEVGLLIARLRTLKLQEKALGYIRGKYIDLKDGGKKSFRAVRDLLNERFTLDLKDAMFNVEDEMLVPAAGHCMRCPKRSGNAPEFEDVIEATKESRWSRVKVGPDVCTDPDCFDAKKKAHLKREADKLTATGKTVVDGNKARQAVDAFGKLKDGYIAIADVREALKKAKDKKITTLHIQDPRTGKVHQAVKQADLVAAGVKAAAKPKKAAGGYDDERYEKERQKRDAGAKAESELRKALLLRVREKARAMERSTFDLRVIARHVLASMAWKDKELLEELHGVSWDQLDDAIDGMSSDDLAMLMLDITLCHENEINGYDWEAKRMPAFSLYSSAEHYGIDVDALREEINGPPTPSTAARARKKGAADATENTAASAALAPTGAADDDTCLERTAAHIAKAKKKSKGKALRADQTDDAGVAGGDDAQAELLEQAED